jgi:predicted CopG family antitoxin
MKTLSITEEAYDRLLAHKAAGGDSFSKVILRMVPKKGTAGQLLDRIQLLPELSAEEGEALERTVAEGNDWRAWRDPWTTN